MKELALARFFRHSMQAVLVMTPAPLLRVGVFPGRAEVEGEVSRLSLSTNRPSGTFRWISRLFRIVIRLSGRTWAIR